MNIATRNVLTVRLVPPRVEDHADALVVVEEREDEREDDHPEDLEQHAGVVDERDEPHAEDVEQRDQEERDDRDDPLVVTGCCAMSQPMLLKAGMSASGRVTHTEVTVRIPANR